MKTLYGITYEDYERMFEAQGGRCAICRKEEERALSVDHCHKTGRVRGLLCRHCNMALGLFRDDPGLVVRAADYLTGGIPIYLDEMKPAKRRIYTPEGVEA